MSVIPNTGRVSFWEGRILDALAACRTEASEVEGAATDDPVPLFEARAAESAVWIELDYLDVARANVSPLHLRMRVRLEEGGFPDLQRAFAASFEAAYYDSRALEAAGRIEAAEKGYRLCLGADSRENWRIVYMTRLLACAVKAGRFADAQRCEEEALAMGSGTRVADGVLARWRAILAIYSEEFDAANELLNDSFELLGTCQKELMVGRFAAAHLYLAQSERNWGVQLLLQAMGETWRAGLYKARRVGYEALLPYLDEDLPT